MGRYDICLTPDIEPLDIEVEFSKLENSKEDVYKDERKNLETVILHAKQSAANRTLAAHCADLDNVHKPIDRVNTDLYISIIQHFVLILYFTQTYTAII